MHRLLEASKKMYVRPALPLKWLASHRKDNPIFVQTLKIYNASSDLLTMMSILELLNERPILRSDLQLVLPVDKRRLGEFINKDVKVQKLSSMGIKLAELYIAKRQQECKNYLFYILMRRKTNERLPDFFARFVQTPSMFDSEIQKNEFKKAMHAKDPEADHVFLWTKFFGINVSSKGGAIILDRRWTVYYLFHAQLQVANDLVKTGNIPLAKYFAYSVARSSIEKELYILPNGLSVDNFFQMMEEIVRDVKGFRIGWEPDRELFVGTGHMGNPKRARIMVTGELPQVVTKDLIDTVADDLGLLRAY